MTKGLQKGGLACILFGLRTWVRVRVKQESVLPAGLGSRRLLWLSRLTMLGFVAEARRVRPSERELIRRCATWGHGVAVQLVLVSLGNISVARFCPSERLRSSTQSQSFFAAEGSS